MTWLSALGELAQRYAGSANQNGTENTHEDFQQVVEAAPRDVVSNGIAQMFRSDQTPAFPTWFPTFSANRIQTRGPGF